MSITLAAEGYDEARVRASIYRILSDVALCSMATVSDKGTSHINTAFFCYDEDLSLFFVSDPRTTHCRNIARRSSIAIAVFDSTQRWDGMKRGLQLFGRCRHLSLITSKRARVLYAKRFAGFDEYYNGLGAIEKAFVNSAFYIFEARSVKVFDEPEYGEETFVHAKVARHS